MKRNFIIIIIVVIIAIIFAFLNYYNIGNDKDNTDNRIGELGSIEKNYTVEDLNHLHRTNNFLPSAIKHIFIGTINNDGKAEGFHYANIKNSHSKIIADTESSPNNFGVFKAKVKINGIIKSDDNGYSTFFPSSLSPQEVIDSINQAYNNAKNIHGNIYVGKSNTGMEIEMYLTSDNKIISAFPKY